jgi:uncharacterized protein
MTPIRWCLHVWRALLIVGLGALPLPCVALAQSSPPPIIDVHFHAYWFGPEIEEALPGMPAAPKTREELHTKTLAALRQYNIVKVVASGDFVEDYQTAVPDRVIPGIAVPGIAGPGQLDSIETLRRLHQEGRLAVFAEFEPQYEGFPSADPVLAPYWALAEELDIPVGSHMGLGPPGAAYGLAPKYRMALSNPLLLEEVLIRHPKLRVYVMHAGWPMLDGMLGLLFAYPQVYVDVGVINWALPRAEFYTYLKRLVEAGFGKRIMFGSDNMVWPESFGIAIEAIRAAPFLTENDKRDIFCTNAMRFLRLPKQTCD